MPARDSKKTSKNVPAPKPAVKDLKVRASEADKVKGGAIMGSPRLG